MRKQCHWLALAASLLIAVGAIFLTLLWPLGNLAKETEAGGCSVPQQIYQSPQCCSECHPAEHQAWASSTHALARVDPRFQIRLQQEQEPGDCLQCHTTGYDAASGRYALAGVTCEVCHSPYPAMTAVTSPQDLCGTCHIHTIDEWRAGMHGEAQETCISCHPIHS